MAHSLFKRLARIARAEFDLHRQKKYNDPVEQKSYDDSSSNFGANTGFASSQDAKIANYYANLEIPYDSDLETVTKAWKKLLRKYHPDMHSTDPEKVKIANEIVQVLNNAYNELQKYLAK